jgi:hypothetical protein
MRFALLALSATALATLAGCGPDEPPAIPQGAFNVSTVQTDPIACMIAGHSTQVGEIDESHRKDVIASGMDGAVVNCTVSGTSPFSVNGDITQDDRHLAINIPSIKPGATLASPAVGTIQYSSVKTAGNAYGGTCNYYFTEMTSETVASGRIWVSFQCDALVSGMSTCPIKQGYVILENCLTVGASGG